MDKEIWKEIEGFMDIYEVSNLWNVKSLRRRVFSSNWRSRVVRERILKITNSVEGYKKITFKYNCINYTYQLWRLVYTNFINKNINWYYIDYIDWNPMNCQLNNLIKQKISNSIFHKHGKEYIWKHKHSKEPKKILQYNNIWKVINNFLNIYEASIETWIKIGSIRSACNWNRKSWGGFYWKYLI